jgi:hypothetical protein
MLDKMMIRKSKGLLDTAWGAKLRALERDIKKAEGDSLLARWEFGKTLLIERKGGKQLPKGLLDQMSREMKLSGTELRYRMRFAEKYPTKPEVSNAIGDFPSWYQMTQRGLHRPKRPRHAASKPKPGAYTLELHRTLRWLPKIQAARLTENDIELVRRLALELGRLQEAIGRVTNAIPTHPETHHG